MAVSPADPPSARPRPVPFGASFPEVLAAGQADAPWAYRRLFEWLARPVAGYLRSQGTSDPDGLANDVFLRAFTNLGDFRGSEDRFRSWVFAIAHNVAVDDRRRTARQPARTSWPAEDRPGRAATEEEAFARLGAGRVEALLASLSVDQRNVLTLRFVADLTVEQIADVLGKAPGAVKQLQRRGLASLRRQLGPRTESEGAEGPGHTLSPSSDVHPPR